MDYEPMVTISGDPSSASPRFVILSYLHNGSVPTLYHLLLPADQRPKKFHVGQKDYDPVHVGFEIDPN